MGDVMISTLLVTVAGITIGILASRPMNKRVTYPAMVSGLLMVILGFWAVFMAGPIYLGSALLFVGTALFSIGFVGAWHRARQELNS